MTFPQFVDCGDRALLIYLGATIDPDLNARVHALTEKLHDAHPAITEVTASYHALLVEFDPVRLRSEALLDLIQQALATLTPEVDGGRLVTLPVTYGGERGPDLDRVAQATGLPPDLVVERHSGAEYRVYALGFSPGFPYLGGLDATLSTPRLDEPRVHVPAGAVGIAGNQTGLYPQASPGGWNLIGQTPVRLFDPTQDPPALLAPGDRVRFQPISEAQFAALTPASSPAVAPVAEQAGLRVIQAGLQTTIQDLGRRGYARYGVSPAGAVDFWSLMVGNWLLGNRARTAALEVTVQGPEVEVTGPLAFAITGAPIQAELLPADGSAARPLAPWRSYLASPGDRIRLGAVHQGCRSYLCVLGGVDLPPVLGSLSEDLFGKIGPLGRPLRAGDWLPLGLPLHSPAEAAGRALPAAYLPDWTEGPVTLRFVPGPQPFPAEALARLAESSYTVTPTSDRQGLRLNGAGLVHGAAGADILSEPIAPGSIQVPSNGQPILLLGNRQTIGGYAKIGVVIYPDLARAGQVRPGDQVRFEAITLAEAQAITRAERRRLAAIRRLLERGDGLVQVEGAPEGTRAVAPFAGTSADAVAGPTGFATGSATGATTGAADGTGADSTNHSAVFAAGGADVPSLAESPRRFRISISGIEFTADVEEVEEVE